MDINRLPQIYAIVNQIANTFKIQRGNSRFYSVGASGVTPRVGASGQNSTWNFCVLNARLMDF